MGKYESYVKVIPQHDKANKTVHPVWRGIGLIMVIAVPFFSYIGALVILQQNQTANWFPIPTDILSPWGSDPLIFVKLVITVVLIVVISAVLTLITFVMNALLGAPRYGPQDSPPIHGHVKPRYRR